MMTYDEALGFIHGATRVGARDGFVRMERILEIIGNPHHKLKFVHVAGTNGKGSTATMTANILTRAGYKTGLFVSPYVVDFRERIQLNGQLIPKDELRVDVWFEPESMTPTHAELISDGYPAIIKED